MANGAVTDTDVADAAIAYIRALRVTRASTPDLYVLRTRMEARALAAMNQRIDDTRAMSTDVGMAAE